MSGGPTQGEQLMFLPGAGGDSRLWRPVAEGLRHGGARRFWSWPGLGGAPADASVTSLEDLVRQVVAAITSPTLVFGQSMGGIVALRATLAAPAHVRGLVLSVTSGGIDLAGTGAVDWRPDFAGENPDAPRWFLDARDDLTQELDRVRVPVLLLWGDADPISPLALGERLASLLPDAELVVIPGGRHDLVSTRSSDVLPHVERYLEKVLL
jgi:pimeloyl-ACP methyl ester carboxylesterase